MLNANRCIVTDGGLFVGVTRITNDGNPVGAILTYGEKLIDIPPPNQMQLCKPVLSADGRGWEESATPEEIIKWEQSKPKTEQNRPTAEQRLSALEQIELDRLLGGVE